MYDVIVIGGGPAGSTAASLLARKNHSVLLLEREQFPRFQIGESLLPHNNPLFEELGILDRLRSFPMYVKSGAEFVTADESRRQVFQFGRHLSPELATSFQVRRDAFDELLLRNAEASGAEVRERVSVAEVDLSNPARVRVSGATRDGERVTVESRFVVDATGHQSLLASRQGTRQEVASLKKVALFGHFRGMSGRPAGVDEGNTVIVVLRDAWFWLIPLDRQLTSVGLVLDRDLLARSELSPERMFQRTCDVTPYVRSRLEAAERVGPIHARKDFSFRVQQVTGPNYCLVGDAAGFFDPIFSTGVFLAMKTAQLAADAVHRRLTSGGEGPLRMYERRLEKAMTRYFAFISRFYRREFLEVFLNPQERFGLLPVVVSLLAGDVFETKGNRWRIPLFFALTRLQRFRPVIAPPIDWEALPQADRSGPLEEDFARTS